MRQSRCRLVCCVKTRCCSSGFPRAACKNVVSFHSTRSPLLRSCRKTSIMDNSKQPNTSISASYLYNCLTLPYMRVPPPSPGVVLTAYSGDPCPSSQLYRAAIYAAEARPHPSLRRAAEGRQLLSLQLPQAQLLASLGDRLCRRRRVRGDSLRTVGNGCYRRSRRAGRRSGWAGEARGHVQESIAQAEIGGGLRGRDGERGRDGVHQQPSRAGSAQALLRTRDRQSRPRARLSEL